LVADGVGVHEPPAGELFGGEFPAAEAFVAADDLDDVHDLVDLEGHEDADDEEQQIERGQEQVECDETDHQEEEVAEHDAGVELDHRVLHLVSGRGTRLPKSSDSLPKTETISGPCATTLSE
jgi:hypothetical protein